MEREHLNIQMVIHTRESGKVITGMAKALLHMLMEHFIVENGTMG